MGALDKLESQLDVLLNKKAPVQLPANGRKGLANAMWWIALVIGLLDLWNAAIFWQAGHIVDRSVDVVNNLSAYYGGPAVVAAAPHLGLFYYLSLLVMAAVGVLLLVATPGLKAMKKAGWNYVFYAAVIEAAVAVLRLFSGVDGGLFAFIGAAIGAVLGAYFLFQVRDYFTGAKSSVETTTSHDHKTAKEAK